MEDDELGAAAPRGWQPPAPAPPAEGEPMWPAHVVETLLEERVKMLRDGFGDRDKRNQGACWAAATRVLNSTHARSFTSEQVRNKLKNLRTLVRKVRAAEAHPTPGRKAPKKPSYWPALVRHFGDSQGRGGVEAVLDAHSSAASLSTRDEERDSDGDEASDAESRADALQASPASVKGLEPLAPMTFASDFARHIERNASGQVSSAAANQDDSSATNTATAAGGGDDEDEEDEREDSGSDAAASDRDQSAAQRLEDERKWPLAAVQSLLQERKACEPLFSDASGREDKANAWHCVRRGVNSKHARGFTTKQVKNKYGNLRAAYRRVCDADARYAAASTRAPKRPAYWPALVQHFGSMASPGDAMPARLTSLLHENADNTGVSAGDAPDRRASHVVEGGEAIRMAGESIRDGLVALGEHVSTAFASSRPVQHAVASDAAEDRARTRQHAAQAQETLELLRRHVRSTARTNELLELQADQTRQLLALQVEQCQLQREQSEQVLAVHNKLMRAISQLTDKLEKSSAVHDEQTADERHARVRARNELEAPESPAAKRRRREAGE